MGIYAFVGILTVLGIVISLWRDRQPRTRARVLELLLLNVLVFAVGVFGVIAFSGHAFKADEIAREIGFPSGNPFQFEVAIADLTIGVLGLLCIWLRGSFWLATIIATSVWLLGDAVGHIHELVSHHNHHPGNSGPALWADIAIPLIAIVLYALYRQALAREEVESDLPLAAAMR